MNRHAALVPTTTTALILAELERAQLWQKRLHDPWCWFPWICITIELLLG